MAHVPFQGVLLAAGLGTRLRPLTLVRPKPLIPVGSKTPAQLALENFARASIHKIAINTHHLAPQIEDFVKNNPYLRRAGHEIHISHEKEILGTGGVFGPLANWMREENILVYNGDILCDVDLAAVVNRHLTSQARVTMVLLKSRDHAKTPVFVDRLGDVVGIGKIQKPGVSESETHIYSFTGIHAIETGVLKLLPPNGPSEIVPLYQKMIGEGARISAILHEGLWFDMGDPRSLFATYEHLFFNELTGNANLGLESKTAVVVGRKIEMHGSTSIGPNVWVSSPTLLDHARSVTNSLLLEGAVVESGEVIDHEVRAFGERLIIPV